MKITRVYTGDDLESHFEDIEVPLTDLSNGIGAISKTSRLTSAKGTCVIAHRWIGRCEAVMHCSTSRPIIDCGYPIHRRFMQVTLTAHATCY